MLALQVKTDDFKKKVEQFAKVPEALRRTVIFSLQDTVNDVHKRQLIEMELAFDRPTKYLKRGLLKRFPAGKERPGFLAPSVAEAGTYFNDFTPKGMAQEDVIRPHIYGGARSLKRHERRLRQYGIMGSNQWTVMGKNFERDRHGNIPASRYSQMLSDLSTIPEARSYQTEAKGKFKSRRKSKEFFVAKNKAGETIGIAERRGKNKRVLMLKFVNTPTYKKRYRYKEVGRSQVSVSLPRHFVRIINKEMKKMFR